MDTLLEKVAIIARANSVCQDVLTFRRCPTNTFFVLRDLLQKSTILLAGNEDPGQTPLTGRLDWASFVHI